MTLPKAPGVVVEDSVALGDSPFTRTDTPSFSLRVAYYNHTGRDLTVVNRSGVAHKLAGRPKFGAINKSLYVAITYDATDYETVILDRPEISDSDRNYRSFSLARNARSQNLYMTNKERAVTVVYEIPDDAIVTNTALYYRNLDIVVSLSDLNVIPKHPYEFSGALHNELLVTDGLLQTDEFRFGILLVDNNGRIGPRYVNINGRLFKVPAARRSNLRDGVYLKTSEWVMGDTGLPPPADISYYSLEEYEKACESDVTLLRLFVSLDQARTLGDMQSARKAELEKIAFERKMEEEEWRRQKNIDDRENNKLKADLEEKEQRYEKEKREWEQRNAESERLRKDLEHQMKMNELQFQAQLQSTKHEQAIQKLDREREEKNGWNITVKDCAVLIAGVTACATAITGLYKLYKSYEKE